MVSARETTFRSCWRGPSSAKCRCIGAPYSWSKAQLKRLWEDITGPTDDRVTDCDATHSSALRFDAEPVPMARPMSGSPSGRRDERDPPIASQ